MDKHDLHFVIKRPLMTEKSTKASAEGDKYVFEVDPKASKPDIKKAVETIYKVKVLKINTSVSATEVKQNRWGLFGGKPRKKAFVRLVAGQKIELF
jgi:large subunit ribosomal protein L23